MSLTNVKLILLREIRDQSRDRRTLFMIVVLPMLLYPLMGMSFLQIKQFLQEQPTRVLVIGAKSLAGLPPLVEDQRFAAGLFNDSDSARLLEVHLAPEEPHDHAPQDAAEKNVLQHEQAPGEEARQAVQAGQCDAALFFPNDFAKRLTLFREAIQQRAKRAHHGQKASRAGEADVPLQVPSPEIIYSTASEKSMLAFGRLSDVLRRWTEAIGEDNLAASGMPSVMARPFVLETADIARESGLRGAATWAKILPMLLVLWAMTGAFYPAIDLCAGEKERGTLETLLSSPAQRSEIVLGKLLTIMLFSIITAVLNLVSIGITAMTVVSQMPELGMPQPIAILWLALALLPVAALFSALCLALAAFARSAKEGQYYLMPLLLVTMPLVVLPLSPSVELNLGNSLIPVTGLVLLLRSALGGNPWQAVQYVPTVVAVTLACCLLSIRWAVEQFNSEAVLFRESERLDVTLWLRHLVRDRGPTPTVAGAVCCGMLILAVRYFMSMSVPPPEPDDFGGFAKLVLLTQLVVVVAPTLLLTFLLSGSRTATLLLRRPRWLALPAAALLAAALHPIAIQVQAIVTKLYPPDSKVLESLEKMQQLVTGGSDWQKLVITLLLMAALPAVCEELAFRGFILSGLRHLGHKWRAIIYSALFFGVTHIILQQSLMAALLGVVLGYVAVQTGSIFPGMIFHLVHNSLPLLMARITAETLDRSPVLNTLMAPGTEGGCVYHRSVIVVGAIAAACLLWWLSRLPCQKSAEEEFQQAIARGTATPAGSRQ